jgi:sugar fermentation stimulation protein A
VDLYARIKKDVWNLQPDVLSILIGVNDVWHELDGGNGVDLVRFEKIYRILLDDTLERFPNLKILLCEPFILKGSATVEKWEEFLQVKEYAKVVKKLANEYGFDFLPLQETLDKAAALNGSEYYAADGVHPTAEGAKLIAAEWLKKSGLFPAESTLKTEVKCKDSRFDLWIENTYIEVKGITLNQEGIARFPDAPTLRGVKHLNELSNIAKNGGKAMILFVVQMKGIRQVEPNDQTHPAFGQALRYAAKAGVKILAIDCKVTPNEIVADQILPVCL